ncbi:MAG: beta-CASP ribonuclease aCPSF1 [Euryarchaeota archaeon]|nr:beta-CASP ribonuclease aCPSF1 [Euryarchaeota archaeon]
MHQIDSELQRRLKITKIKYEGPFIALYTKKPVVFTPELLKELSIKLDGKAVVRSDPSIRVPPFELEKIIYEKISEHALNKIYRNDELGEALVELKKGFFLANRSEIINQLIWATGWIIDISERLEIPSKITKMVNRILYSNERKAFLEKIAERIFRKKSEEEFWLRLTALGGCREVGGSCLFVQTPSSRVLLDCGIETDKPESLLPKLNAPEFDVKKLDAIIISHAHIDHSGSVPYIFKIGYDGPVYCTRPTLDIMVLLQLDNRRVLQKRGFSPPYQEEHINQLIAHTIPIQYKEQINAAPDIKVTLYNSGHVIGSSSIYLETPQSKFFYTGDFCFLNTRFLERAESNLTTDTLVIESTYGRKIDIHRARKTLETELIETIKKTISQKGKVLIPVFAVGRSQELLLIIQEYMRSGILEKTPVFIDGMINEVNSIYLTYPEYLKESLQRRIYYTHENPIYSPLFHIVKKKHRAKVLLREEPAIILATSGMMTGGPVIDYLKELNDPKNTLIIVGYQVEGTTGREILDGQKFVKLPTGEEIELKIKVAPLLFSAHADRPQLLNFVQSLSVVPKKIIVCHGEEETSLEFGQTLENRIKTEVWVPRNLDAIRL